MKNIHLNEMYVFVKVAEVKSFTKAGQTLHASKQTISKKIIQLEEGLGVDLFRRNTRNFELTTAGHEYYKNCMLIIQQAELANTLVQEYQSRPIGNITTCMPGILSHANVSSVISGFLKKNPELQLDITMSDRKACLVNDGIDVAFHLGSLDDSAMIARDLGKMEFMLIAAPDYMARHGQPQDWKDLDQHVLIDSCPIYGDYGGLQHKHKYVKVNDTVIAKQFALEGLGISILPKFVCVDELDNKNLLIIDSQRFSWEAEVKLIYLKNKHFPIYIRKFIDYIVPAMKVEAPWNNSCKTTLAPNLGLLA
ncbi:MAG: LysR family transcriptional regulator [Cellvibrionaceae bacterium]|nr:LysR family transcriptional regulator [Cellvibrionaceae bacterium]